MNLNAAVISLLPVKWLRLRMARPLRGLLRAFCEKIIKTAEKKAAEPSGK